MRAESKERRTQKDEDRRSSIFVFLVRLSSFFAYISIIKNFRFFRKDFLDSMSEGRLLFPFSNKFG